MSGMSGGGGGNGASITPARIVVCAIAGVALYAVLRRWRRGNIPGVLRLGSDPIGAKNIVLRSPAKGDAALALGNLSPIISGHAVVITASPVTRLAQLTSKELDDLFSTVRHTQALLRRYCTSV